MQSTTQTQILLGYNQFLCAEGLASGGQFSLSLFEDLNKFIESVVLYDKVVLLGDYFLPSGVFAQPLQQEGILDTITDNEIRSIMLNEDAKKQFQISMENIFGPASLDADDAQPERLIELRIPPNAFDSNSYNNFFNQTVEYAKSKGFEKDRFTKWIAENIFETRSKGGHFYYFARSIVYSTYAEIVGLDYAPDLLRLPIAALSFLRRTTPLSKILYDTIVEKIQSEIDALTLLGQWHSLKLFTVI